MDNLQARSGPSFGKLLPAEHWPWTAVPGRQPRGEHLGTQQPQPPLRARVGLSKCTVSGAGSAGQPSHSPALPQSPPRGEPERLLCPCSAAPSPPGEAAHLPWQQRARGAREPPRCSRSVWEMQLRACSGCHLSLPRQHKCTQLCLKNIQCPRTANPLSVMVNLMRVLKLLTLNMNSNGFQNKRDPTSTKHHLHSESV